MLPKRKAYITKLFIISWLIIFILDISLFTKASSPSDWILNILWNSHGHLSDLLALIPVRLANYEYWRIISYAFIHFGIIHIVGNILLISFVGNVLESKISVIDFIIPVFLGDIIAGIGCMVFVNFDHAYINGSSPGIYALYGVLVSNLYFRKIKSSVYMSATARNRIIVILLAVNFLGADTFVIHAIGFVVGLVCGFIQVKCNRVFKET